MQDASLDHCIALVQAQTHSANIHTLSPTQVLDESNASNSNISYSPTENLGMASQHPEQASNGRNPKYSCKQPECSHLGFGRPAELARHTIASHSPIDAALWCPVPSCDRSQANVDKPFPPGREDKVKEHIQKRHKSESERKMWPSWFQKLKIKC